MMNSNPAVRRFSPRAILPLAAVALAALTLSSVAFCGEIHEAIRDRDVKKVGAMLKADPALANARHTEMDNQTPLHWAATVGSKAITELLLANKADVNATNNFGQTPLFSAVAMGYSEVTELLLANKADVNVKEKDGRTPLHWTALRSNRSNKDVAALLLAHKADVDAKNNKGETPLHLAAASGRSEVVEVLLANKADVNAQDNKGGTPLTRASEALQKLEQWKERPAESQAKQARIEECKRILDMLRQHGAKK